MFEENFSDCPWSVPSYFIYLCKKTKLHVLQVRQYYTKLLALTKDSDIIDKLGMLTSKQPDATYFDDNTVVRKQPHRHYAFHTNTKPVIYENRWSTFLNFWTAADLVTATNMLSAHVYARFFCHHLDLMV